MEAPQGVESTGTNRPSDLNTLTFCCSRSLCGSRDTTGNHCSTGYVLLCVSVVIAVGKHPVPFRTRKLSPPAPMVLHRGRCGRVGHRRTSTYSREEERTPRNIRGAFSPLLAFHEGSQIAALFYFPGMPFKVRQIAMGSMGRPADDPGRTARPPVRWRWGHCDPRCEQETPRHRRDRHSLLPFTTLTLRGGKSRPISDSS
jgi:hypothetical protein